MPEKGRHGNGDRHGAENAMMEVLCSRCRKPYYSVLRDCPKCGAQNEACTSKFELYQVELDDAVVFSLREYARTKGVEPLSLINEAIEEYLDRHRQRTGGGLAK